MRRSFGLLMEAPALQPTSGRTSGAASIARLGRRHQEADSACRSCIGFSICTEAGCISTRHRQELDYRSPSPSRVCERRRDGGGLGCRHRRFRDHVFRDLERGGTVRRANVVWSAGGVTGRTTFATLVWLVVWGAGLHTRWREREIAPGRVFGLTLALVGAGVVGTFPPRWGLLSVFGTSSPPPSGSLTAATSAGAVKGASRSHRSPRSVHAALSSCCRTDVRRGE
jgi:hypothetical protein